MTNKLTIESETQDPAALSAILAYAPETYWDLNEPYLDSKTMQPGTETIELDRQIKDAITSGDWSDVKLPRVEFGLHRRDCGWVNESSVPRFKRYEVEIARLTQDTGGWQKDPDVIIIRARPSSKGIVYRVVDEYEGGLSLVSQDIA